MSILVKTSDAYFEFGDELLSRCSISAEEFEAKSREQGVADQDLTWDQYGDSVQIGCGCCMDKASYGASC